MPTAMGTPAGLLSQPGGTILRWQGDHHQGQGPQQDGKKHDGRYLPDSTDDFAILVSYMKTNKRRIIEFFLSPIVKYAKESLTLR